MRDGKRLYLYRQSAKSHCVALHRHRCPHDECLGLEDSEVAVSSRASFCIDGTNQPFLKPHGHRRAAESEFFGEFPLTLRLTHFN